MGFWSGLRSALNIAGKAAQVAAPALGNEKTSKIVEKVGKATETVTEEKDQSKHQTPEGKD
jgi:hypothetical protein